MPTALYTDLQARIAELDTHLLPAVVAGVAYSPQDYDRVRAFIVLAHAEFEYFIERRVLEEVAKRVGQWDQNRRPSAVLMGLLAFRQANWPHVIESLAAPSKGSDMTQWDVRDTNARLAKCVTSLNHHIRNDNHGIKTGNVLRMLLPLGFGTDDLDSTLCANLDSFGSTRGSIAHTGGRHVTQQPDPADVRTMVADILSGLLTLDASISALT